MINANQIKRYEEAKKMLSLRLVNRRLNMKKYAEVPYKYFLDLAVVVVINFPSEDDIVATAIVNKDLLSTWPVSFEEMYADAFRNFMKEKTKLINMNELLKSMGVDESLFDDEIQMYILTNDKQMYGASHILKSEVLEEFASEHRSDIWVLPSSIHETILLPSRDIADMDNLTEIVQSVNRDVVDPNEVLSDHAYLYKWGIGWSGYCV